LYSTHFLCGPLQEIVKAANISIVVVVVNFISGLLNNIDNKKNNTKPEKGHSDKTIYVKTCTR